MTSPGASPHAHDFPCQPPRGDILAPGDCTVCGKPYALDVAQKRAAEAGMALVDPADLRAARDAIATAVMPGTFTQLGGLLGRLSAAAEVTG